MNSKKKFREFVLLEKSTPRKNTDREQIKSIDTRVKDLKKENDEPKGVLFDMKRLNHELKEVTRHEM